MTPATEEALVHADFEWHDAPAVMGQLRRQRSRGEDLVSFAYEGAWLAGPDAIALDPDLALEEGAQYPPQSPGRFGIFLDSAPDRWGRTLMQRREAARARAEGRRARTLGEWDFLLGVHDETRLGALRFSVPPDPSFVAHDADRAAPPITSLRELLAASDRFERDEGDEDDRWIAQLFAPGSSLGGARPKASVRDEHGALWIAKFPSRADRHDVGAWELVAHRLASRAGIAVPEARIVRVPDSAYSTFVARRFDRTDAGRRRAFVSAMTLTQRRDGETGASYLELVEVLQRRGARTGDDARELFRRVVFNILVHNTDDHLRNHGFIVEREGLVLSPAYDINPVPGSGALALAIDEHDPSCDVSIAMAACGDYGLTRREADQALSQVTAAVVTWREVAREVGIPRAQQDAMREAFEPL